MKEELSKATTNFSRGLSTLASHMIGQHECRVAENFLFDDAVPYVRGGIQVYGSAPAPILGLRRFYKKTGSSYFVAFTNLALYSAAVSGTFAQISSEALASGPVESTVYSDELYFTNGSNVVMVFDGSTIAPVGISSPVYRVQLADFETDESWTTGIVDTTYTHRDKGDQALRLGTSGTGGATSGLIRSDLSTTLGLHHFATNVSSVDDDLIKIHTLHERKANISTIDLLFDCNDGDFSDVAGDCYQIRLTDLSSWQSLSGVDGWGVTHVIPKTLFTAPTGDSSWSTVIGVRIEMAQTSEVDINGGPANCAFDNLRMVKCPPIPIPLSSHYTFGGVSAYIKTNWGSGFWQGFKPGAGAAAPAGYGHGSYQFTEAYYRYVRGQQITGEDTGGISGGRYFYKSTLMKEGPNGVTIESNPTYESSGLAVSGNLSVHTAINVTTIPWAPDGSDVTAVGLYRRRSDQETFSHYRTIRTAQPEDDLDDTNDDLAGRTLEQDHWPPPQAKYIFRASNQRVYYANIIEDGEPYPSRVRASKAYEPYYVPLNPAWDLAANDGSVITGIFEFLNLIHILKETSLWMLDENDTLRNMHPLRGCIAPRSLAVGEAEALWLGDGAIYLYNTVVKNISKPRDPEKPNVDAIIKRLPQAYLDNAVGTYFDQKYLLAVTDEGSTINNLVIVYDLTTDTWSTFPDLSVTCWATWTAGQDGYRLFFGNYSGQVCELFAGDYDISTPIHSAIGSKDFGIISPEVAFRKGYIQTEALDSQSRTLLVEPYFNFTTLSGDRINLTVSGTHNITKFNMPQKPGYSYGGIQITTSGRYRMAGLDLYGKEESIR